MTQFKSIQLLVASLFFVVGFSWSQGNLTNKQITSEWSLLDVRSGVEVYVQRQDCQLIPNQLPLEFLFIKLVNTTDKQATISYSIQTLYTEGCVGCDENPEGMVKTQVAASSDLAGNCENLNHGFYVLLNNPNLKKGWTFQSIQLNKLTVN